MKRLVAAAVVLFLFAFAGGRAPAQVSLWNTDSSSGDEVNLLRPVKARDFKVHDILHIVVIVSAESTTDEEVELEKEAGPIKLSIDQFLKLAKGESLIPHLKSDRPDDLGMDISGDKAFGGEGTADRKDALRTRLAAEIVEVKPNGNLVIEAKSRFTKSREKTVITLSGTVRPQDVSPENSVYSYNIADLDINYESAGPVADATRRGWLMRLIDKLWPF